MIIAVDMKRFAVCVTAFVLILVEVACGSRDKPAAPVAAETHVPAAVAPTVDPNDRRPVIVTFGDSISAGYGVEPGKSYPDDLQRLIDKAGYKYRIVNLGISGDTTTGGLERLPSVIVTRPAIVIVEFGGNDGLRGQPVHATRTNLAAIVEGLQKAGIKVVLAGMTLPRNYGPEYIASFDKMFPDLARQYKLTLVPFILDGVGGNPALTQPDGIHPTAEGAEIVAQNVMKYLKPMLR